jgi:hypothetical protein
MSDCLKAWVAAEANGSPHLVEDPQAIILRLRNHGPRRATAGIISLPGDAGTMRLTSEVESAFLEIGGSESVEIELAIGELRRIIADKEGEANVRRSSTLDFLQRVD